MTMLAATAPPRAVWAMRNTLPEGLWCIHDARVAASIWQRPRHPALSNWIDALPPECLPGLRGVMAPRMVEHAVLAACDAVGLPGSAERDLLAGDCGVLAEIFGLVMATPRIMLRLEVIRTDACKRFHLDRVPARLLCTYRGRGTEFGPVAPEGEVTRISALEPGEAAIFRGSLWPREDCGLLHRSPAIAGTGETRLLLVIDLPEDDEENCDCRQPH